MEKDDTVQYNGFHPFLKTHENYKVISVKEDEVTLSNWYMQITVPITDVILVQIKG